MKRRLYWVAAVFAVGLTVGLVVYEMWPMLTSTGQEPPSDLAFDAQRWRESADAARVRFDAPRFRMRNAAVLTVKEKWSASEVVRTFGPPDERWPVAGHEAYLHSVFDDAPRLGHLTDKRVRFVYQYLLATDRNSSEWHYYLNIGLTSEHGQVVSAELTLE